MMIRKTYSVLALGLCSLTTPVYASMEEAILAAQYLGVEPPSLESMDSIVLEEDRQTIYPKGMTEKQYLEFLDKRNALRKKYSKPTSMQTLSPEKVDALLKRLRAQKTVDSVEEPQVAPVVKQEAPTSETESLLPVVMDMSTPELTPYQKLRQRLEKERQMRNESS